jgi:tetratricopeptide (TPR) repeat protein
MSSCSSLRIQAALIYPVALLRAFSLGFMQSLPNISTIALVIGSVLYLCVFQFALWNESAFAQEAPVTDCDTYAASDQDSQRKSTGIPLDKISADLAVPACEAAVKQYPDSTRLIYQLGRAYWKANDFAAAASQYRKAAERGNALAQNNLGVAYENGKGVPQDYSEAL